jgi:hypothetical protein
MRLRGQRKEGEIVCVCVRVCVCCTVGQERIQEAGAH